MEFPKRFVKCATQANHDCSVRECMYSIKAHSCRCSAKLNESIFPPALKKTSFLKLIAYFGDPMSTNFKCARPPSSLRSYHTSIDSSPKNVNLSCLRIIIRNVCIWHAHWWRLTKRIPAQIYTYQPKIIENPHSGRLLSAFAPSDKLALARDDPLNSNRCDDGHIFAAAPSHHKLPRRDALRAAGLCALGVFINYDAMIFGFTTI